MTDLTKRILAFAEFDEATKCEEMFLLGTFRARGMFKRLFEHHKKQRPLIEQLARCVEALESANSAMDTEGGDCMTCDFDGYLVFKHGDDCPWWNMRSALQSLRDVVGEK